MKHQVNFYTDLVRREGRKNKTKGKNKNNLILMFIVDDCSSFAHFEGSTLTTQWVGEGGGEGGSIQPFYSWGQQGEENVVLVSESVDGIPWCRHLNGTS